MFSVEGALFLPSLIVCAVLIFIIFACGATYEFRKKPGRNLFSNKTLDTKDRKRQAKKKWDGKKFFGLRYRKRKSAPFLPETEKPLVSPKVSSKIENV